MSIDLHPRLESEIRAVAESEGISVEEYLERLFRADQAALQELAMLATEGLNSGDPIDVGSDYWDEKHHTLDRQLKSRRPL
jgi:hypothetical protein